MNRSRWVWRTIAFLSVIGMGLLIGGFVYAVKTVLAPTGTIESVAEPDEPPFAAEGSIEIVALGDSLTVGYGDSSGKGYVRGLQERLEKRLNVPVYVVGNFARNGYTTSQVLADVQDREGIAKALERADVIVMSAGGNDLVRVGDELDLDSYRAKIPEAQANIREILATIRDITPDSHIYYIGLYNPFIEFAEIQGTSLAVQAWNQAAFEALEPLKDATFVPTFDLFENQVSRFLSSDGYHLNDEGYARIAERLAMLME